MTSREELLQLSDELEEIDPKLAEELRAMIVTLDLLQKEVDELDEPSS